MSSLLNEEELGRKPPPTPAYNQAFPFLGLGWRRGGSALRCYQLGKALTSFQKTPSRRTFSAKEQKLPIILKEMGLRVYEGSRSHFGWKLELKDSLPVSHWFV